MTQPKKKRGNKTEEQAVQYRKKKSTLKHDSGTGPANDDGAPMLKTDRLGLEGQGVVRQARRRPDQQRPDPHRGAPR